METGRWNNLKREERICKQCEEEEVEDEEHFLLCMLWVTGGEEEGVVSALVCFAHDAL